MKDKPSKRYDEEMLWSGIQKGDRQAFQSLYIAYSEILYNYGMKICPDSERVKDSIHTVFVRVWERRKKIEIKRSLKFYMFTILRRELIHEMQKHRNRSSAISRIEFELSIEDKIIRDESNEQRKQKLSLAISTLSPRQREILFLRFYEDLTYEEISALMSINTNSLYKLYSASLARLKQYFSHATTKPHLLLLIMAQIPNV